MWCIITGIRLCVCAGFLPTSARRRQQTHRRRKAGLARAVHIVLGDFTFVFVLPLHPSRGTWWWLDGLMLLVGSMKMYELPGSVTTRSGGQPYWHGRRSEFSHAQINSNVRRVLQDPVPGMHQEIFPCILRLLPFLKLMFIISSQPPEMWNRATETDSQGSNAEGHQTWPVKPPPNTFRNVLRNPTQDRMCVYVSARMSFIRTDPWPLLSSLSSGNFKSNGPPSSHHAPHLTYIVLRSLSSAK